MAITDTEPESTTTTATAVLTLRIPDSSGADLATDAEHRLARIEGVQTATVEGLRGLEPQFSATLVRFAVTIETARPIADLPDLLSEAVCVDTVDRLTPVE